MEKYDMAILGIDVICPNLLHNNISYSYAEE